MLARMLSRRMRQVAPLALAAALHATTLGTAAPVLAQQSSARVPQDLVARGLQLFEDQRYEESIQTLSAALLRPNNTRAQKVEIHRLLALDFITLNRKDEAESAVRGLLAIEPSYALPASESPRFRDFFDATRKKWESEGRPGLARDGDVSDVAMRHASPSQIEAKTPLALTATLTDPNRRVTGVKVFYRTGSRGTFEQLDATLTGQSVRATVPASAVSPPFVEYYLEGLDKGGLPIVSRGDASAPLRVAVPDPAKAWVLPVAIGGGIVGAAAIVGGLALAGVFKGKSGDGGPAGNTSQVTVSVGESRFRW
jgi:hypothetical protein